jgi:pSer/pThr/pTyr-binding forkhead associated (FHA) protein
MTACPSCGATIQSDATFCGQCGYNLLASLELESEPVATIPDVVPPVVPAPSVTPAATTLQRETVNLLHIQTERKLELPSHLSVIHSGKENDRIPPDIDVSGFPDSDIVSRVHADIRVEGGIYYLEDTGSANGTYINHTVLPPGDRHRLRAGDRISLGKGDKVTFIFQITG